MNSPVTFYVCNWEFAKGGGKTYRAILGGGGGENVP